MDIDPVEILTQQLLTITREGIAVLPQIVLAIVIIFFTWLIAKSARWLVVRLLNRTRIRPSLKNLFEMIAGLAVWVFGLMIAAVVVFPNLTPASMLTGLGIGSVAIGFAFKDIFQNFLAGIIILFRREMRIGDFIECDGLMGKVEKISIRETHIRQVDDQLVITPNAMLFTNPLTIMTDRELRRSTIICGIAYDEDVATARSVIKRAVAGCETVKKNAAHPVQIFAQEFGASSIDFEVTWWTDSTPVAIRKSRDEVVEAVKTALDNAGIEIPFPYLTHTFKEPLPFIRETNKTE